jgi:hypothetical protein
MVKIALRPAHAERVCWGCDQYCRADDLACGNGTERTQHPLELFGSDWLEWAQEQGGYEDFDPSADVPPTDPAPEQDRPIGASDEPVEAVTATSNARAGSTD